MDDLFLDRIWAIVEKDILANVRESGPYPMSLAYTTGVGHIDADSSDADMKVERYVMEVG